jgi:hypothetical protein
LHFAPSNIPQMQQKSLLLFCKCLLLSIKIATPKSCGETFPNCHVFEWNSWGSCSGICGNQTQNRLREMCCRNSLPNRSEETCRIDCGITKPLHQTRTCRTCLYGTLVSSNVCRCHLGYRGKCCEGKPGNMVTSSV